MNSPTRRTFLGAAAAVAASPVVAAEPKQESDKPGRTPHTRFAVNLEMWWTRQRLPFLERLDRAADLGFPAVEFWPWENKDIAAVARKCRELNLEVAQFSAWGFRPGLNDPANHDAFVKKVEAGCEVAKRLNCDKMCVVGGDDIPGMTQAQMHKNIIEGLKRGAPVAEKNKVTLILEPMNIRVDHKGHCLYGTEPAVRITRAVGSEYVKVLFDLYHSHITEGDLCGHLKDGRDQLGYVQIADHPGRNEPGTGEINYTRVFKELLKLGYKSHVGLELRPLTDERTAAVAVWRADQW